MVEQVHHLFDGDETVVKDADELCEILPTSAAFLDFLEITIRRLKNQGVDKTELPKEQYTQLVKWLAICEFQEFTEYIEKRIRRHGQGSNIVLMAMVFIRFPNPIPPISDEIKYENMIPTYGWHTDSYGLASQTYWTPLIDCVPGDNGSIHFKVTRSTHVVDMVSNTRINGESVYSPQMLRGEYLSFTSNIDHAGTEYNSIHNPRISFDFRLISLRNSEDKLKKNNTYINERGIYRPLELLEDPHDLVKIARVGVNHYMRGLK